MKLRWLIVGSCLLGLGCPKEPTSDQPASTATPSATASVSATATATGSAMATASTTATATGSATATASATPVPPVATAPTCGKKPLPDCPLQGWMKKNTNPAMMAKDFPALVTALDTIATFAPPGYGNWASIAKDGANAARAADENGVKAACRSCHEQYKAKYRAELRTRAVP